MADAPKISGEMTQDPDTCDFQTDVTLLEEWTLIFKHPDESLGSPLVDALFAIPGVRRVKVSGSTFSVSKDPEASWPDIARKVVPAVRTVLTADEPPVSTSAVEAVENAETDDLEALIQQLFESHINPALASHGGFVRLERIQDRDVYITMGGGCQGCAASQATLKHGIESAIREVAPSVRQVIDSTDHAAGVNPYYT